MIGTRRRVEEDEGHDRWLVSYADFITLLFAFFVVMYAISSVDAQKWDRVSIGVKAAFVNPRSGGDPITPILAESGGAQGNRSALRSGDEGGAGVSAWEIQLLEDHIEAALKEQGVTGDEDTDPVRVSKTDRGLVIAFDARPLFGDAGVEMRPESAPLLDGVASSLATTGAQLRIEAHTDASAVPDRFASDWELTSAMAGAIARYLIDEHRIGAERIGIAGFGARRPNTGAASDAAIGDRRLEIVVLRAGHSIDEPTTESHDKALRGILDQLEPLPET